VSTNNSLNPVTLIVSLIIVSILLVLNSFSTGLLVEVTASKTVSFAVIQTK
jgi:hypothetical protein